MSMSFRIVLITLLMISAVLSIYSLTSDDPYYAIAYLIMMPVCGLGPEMARFLERFIRWLKRRW